MRNCKKNQRTMFYALYSDKIPVIDEYGNETLETKAGYLAPVKFKATLSNGNSNSEDSPFGKDVSYDRVISSSDVSLPIDEHSIIWYKNKPVIDDNGEVDGDSADYKVSAAPLDGLDSLRIPISKVI